MVKQQAEQGVANAGPVSLTPNTPPPIEPRQPESKDEAPKVNRNFQKTEERSVCRRLLFRWLYPTCGSIAVLFAGCRINNWMLEDHQKYEARWATTNATFNITNYVTVVTTNAVFNTTTNIIVVPTNKSKSTVQASSGVPTVICIIANSSQSSDSLATESTADLVSGRFQAHAAMIDPSTAAALALTLRTCFWVAGFGIVGWTFVKLFGEE